MATTGNLTAQRTHTIEGLLSLANGYADLVLTGAFALDASHGNFLAIDPGGAARDLTLTAEEGREGAFYFIRNTADAAETITIKDDAGNTIVACAQNKWVLVALRGGVWKNVLGINTWA